MKVPVENPFLNTKAKLWDSMSVEAFKEKNLWTRASKMLVDMLMRAVFATEAREVSLLYRK